MSCRPETSGVNGFTLAEVVVAAVLVAAIIGSIVMLSDGVSRSARTGSTVTSLEARVSRAMESIAERLRPSSLSDVVPQPSGLFFTSQLDFIVAGRPQRIALEYEPDDPDDGIDNDDDGLVDEGRIVWTDNFGLPNARRQVLCTSVPELAEGELDNSLDDNGNLLADEPGLTFTFRGRRVIIRLSVEVRGRSARLIRSAQRVLTFRS